MNKSKLVWNSKTRMVIWEGVSYHVQSVPQIRLLSVRARLSGAPRTHGTNTTPHVTKAGTPDPYINIRVTIRFTI